MNTNILEYIVGMDVYYQLWMVAQTTNQKQPFPNRTNVRHNSDSWHPELINQFHDVREVPASIEITSGNHNLDSQARFHAGSNKPTLAADSIELIWGIEKELGSSYELKPFRSTGPCRIKLTGVKMWHHESQLNRRRGDAIIVEQAVFEWNDKENSSGLRREAGPYQITVDRFTAKATMGRVYDGGFRRLGASWATEAGGRIGETRVKDILDKNSILVDYLAAGESVFKDEGEEFIFLTEIGEV